MTFCKSSKMIFSPAARITLSLCVSANSGYVSTAHFFWMVGFVRA